MAAVTALRARGRRVSIELDGVPWRSVPEAAVVEAGLTVGTELDRVRARSLGRALRRHAARDAAVRALARRDHSRASLASRLERAGTRAADRQDALEAATRAGLVDDARFAAARARTLAARGAGDLYVLDDLRRQGIEGEMARAALATIDPEPVRAAVVVHERGTGVRTLRYLASRGFSEESLEGLVADLEPGALG